MILDKDFLALPWNKQKLPLMFHKLAEMQGLKNKLVAKWGSQSKVDLLTDSGTHLLMSASEHSFKYKSLKL